MHPVQHRDLSLIKYTDDFQSFVDISLIGLLIYALTEVYVACFPASAQHEVNLSMVWCSVLLLYGTTTLASIAKNYLRSSDEASLLYIFASLSFVLSLVCQLADGRLFNFQLKDAYRNVTATSLSLIDQMVNSGMEILFLGKEKLII